MNKEREIMTKDEDVQSPPLQGDGVIGAGFSRTGTTSLQTALDTLGQGPTWHMHALFRLDLYAQLRLMSKWIEIGHLYRKRDPKNDVDKLKRQSLLKVALHEYNSFLDVPAILYVEDLMEMFPEKKVLLSTRGSAEEWYRSYENTVKQFSHPSPFVDLGLWLYLKLFPLGILIDRFHANSWTFILPESASNKSEFLNMYDEWNDRIKRVVPADRLIMMNVKEGWAPLAKALNVPVPDRPFPKSNDVAELEQSIVPLRIVGFLTLFMILFVVYLVLGRIFRWIRPRGTNRVQTERLEARPKQA